ncbi:MAG: lysine--tRNA ligase [Chlamydiales bacterium]|nr:lysine--tRNA ligase [Chlamydiales bacterium]
MSFPEPDYHQHEEFRNRSMKLAEIRQMGIDPYPHKYTPSTSIEDLLAKYNDKEVGHSEEAGNGATEKVTIAGRLVLFRAMGKNAFGQVQDGASRVQIMFNRDLTKVRGLDGKEEELTPLKFIEKKLDLGDIVGVEGHLFRTQKGELTIFAKEVTLLCKSLLPLPDKHAGIADVGVRHRKRWLDLISNPDVLQRFQMRSRILHFVRGYFQKQGFLEVETPILQHIYGGAEARPFVTELNALHQEMYLRIALELSLKKLVVGGMEKVFEISKVFRNEGIDRTHNPEFTMLEAYASYWDYNDMMVFTEKLFEEIALSLFNTTKIRVKTHSGDGETEIDMKTPWKRLTMKESIRVYASIDVDALTDEQLRAVLKEKGSVDPKVIAKATRGLLISHLFQELVEKHLIQPHHIIDHPIETTPLCKLHRDPKVRLENVVERFETFINGNEFCNSYSELNDPELQRHLLLSQAEKRLAGDEEAHPLDEEFIEAICQGMPPSAGVGIGMDRLVMLFTGASTIKEVLFFPLTRPEE